MQQVALVFGDEETRAVDKNRLRMTVRCPHCECLIPWIPKLAHGYVYTSGRIVVCGLIDDRIGTANAADAPMYARYELRGTNYMIMECLDCRKEFVVQNFPQVVVWPIPNASVPDEVPESARSALLDAKRAHAMKAETAALLAARTALIRMLREQNCSKLDDLAERGQISKVLAGQANELRHWANLMGHEDVPPEAASPENVEELLGYVDILFDTIYVHPIRLKALQAKRSLGKS